MDRANLNCSFFFKNLSVVGFTEDDALFMTAKEFIDNAVDACKSNHKQRFRCQNVPKVDLHVSNIADTAKVTCRDTGEGILCDSLEHLGVMFSSSKTSAAHSSGKFGIGLKMTSTGKLHVKIRVSDNEVWEFELKLDKGTQSVVVEGYRSYEDLVWPWATEVSAMFRTSESRVNDKRIFLYAALHAYWNPQILITVQSPNKSKTYMPAIISNACDFLRGTCAMMTKVMIVEECTLRSEEFEAVLRAVLLRDSAVKKNEDVNESGTIYLLRSANSTPLLPPDAMSCCIFRSLRDFLKKEGASYGLEFLSADTESPCDDKIINGGAPVQLDRIDGHEMLQACSTIRVKRPDRSTWTSMLLIVNVKGLNVAYGNLSKTYLKGSPIVRHLVSQAFRQILSKMRSSLSSSEFESESDFQFRQAHEYYAPVLAKSLSGIISKGSLDFQGRVVRLLSRNSNVASFPQSMARTPKRVKTEGDIKDKNTQMLSPSEEQVLPSTEELREQLLHLIRERLHLQRDKKTAMIKVTLGANSDIEQDGFSDSNDEAASND